MATTAHDSRQVLSTYLNDHLAGATAALQLLDDMIDASADPDERGAFAALRAEIAEDGATLEQLLHADGGTTSALRQAGGWMAEKAEQLKLLMDDRGGGTLGRLERIETLALGILGKLALWRALSAASIPEFAGTDFSRLEARAGQQHERVERWRIEAAKRVLGAR